MRQDDIKDGRTPGISRRRALAGAALGTAALTLGPAVTRRAAAAQGLTPTDALALAESRRPELLELLSRLIRIRSLSGESGDVAQGVVMDFLSALPYDVEESRDRPSHYTTHPDYMPPDPPGDGPFSNVVARPSDSGSRFALFAHIDTHLVEGGWITNPWEPVIRGSRLYGLGAGDDKGGIAAMLIAASILAERPGHAPVVISSHGKGGGSRGSLPVFQRMKDAGAGIDRMLYVHPAETGRGLADIKHVVRGVLDVSLEVEGWEGDPLEIGLPDSALWGEGGDAFAHLTQLIEQLKTGALADVDVNVGHVTAGERPGGVPAVARAEIRLLFDGDHTWRDLLDALEAEIGSLSDNARAAERQFSARVVPLGRRSNPGAVPWDAPATRTLRSAIESITGRAPDSYPNHYGGDIRYPLRLLGAPSFGIGSLAGNFYGPNEWVDMDDLVRLVAVLVLTLSNWTDGA